ncbi:hypothetical protein SLE2022_271360 [Rubroshorea leprosula]
MAKKKQDQGSEMGSDGHHMNIRNIMKDIEFLGSSHMTWKERKELENRKVVSLGGKPPKKQRLPLSVARVVLKKQKEREEKMSQENLILGRFGGKLGNGAGRSAGKHKPEDRVLKTTEGHFSNGVLDVKHMLHGAPSRENDSSTHTFNKGKWKKGSKNKKQGKKKGGGRKRH